VLTKKNAKLTADLLLYFYFKLVKISNTLILFITIYLQWKQYLYTSF